jgi:hypothetical protein
LWQPPPEARLQLNYLTGAGSRIRTDDLLITNQPL